MMTATDKLRHMLEELGVEWEGDDTPCAYPRTVWGEVGWFLHEAIEYSGGLNVTSEALNVTPEQAISATLGRGTCENISDPPEGFYCSSCGWGDFAEPSHLLTTAKFTDNECGPNFCPNCGKAVKHG